MRTLLLMLFSTLLTFGPPTRAATPADTLIVALSLDGIISFDPAESFETVSTGSLMNIYETLVRSDDSDPRQLAPALSSHWQAGSRERSLLFTLRPNARFASGNPITADDVIYSLTRAVKLNKTPVFILSEFGWTPQNVDAQFIRRGSDQVEIRWPSAIGQDLALRLLTSPVSAIVDSKLVQTHEIQGDRGNAWLRTHSAGSAGWIIQRYVPQQALVLEKNAYAQPPAFLQRVILKNVSDAGTRRLLLENGDVDVAYDLGADAFATLRQQNKVNIYAFPSSLIYYLGFNTQDKQQPALGNPALWQAARWLVDYRALSGQLLKDQYQVHQTFLPAGFDGALTDTPFHYDVAKARAILDKADIKPGTRFTLTVVNQPPYSEVAQALQASFAKADIHIDIQPVAEAELWGKMRSRQFQSIFIYWGADYVDANSNASTFAYNVPNGPKTLAWRVGWTIPELSALTRDAAAESDAAKRTQRYQQLQTAVQQNSPFVVALQGLKLVAAGKQITGATQGIGVSLLRFDRIRKQ